MLENRPDDEVAKVGLVEATGRSLTAADLLASVGPDVATPPLDGLTSRKLHVLRKYLSRLKGEKDGTSVS